jgi:hypothetical protein
MYSICGMAFGVLVIQISKDVDWYLELNEATRLGDVLIILAVLYLWHTRMRDVLIILAVLFYLPYLALV